MRSRRVPALALLLLAAGCKKPAGDGAAASASVVAVTPGATHTIETGELSSASAFDLAAGPGGLHLMWAGQATGAGWLFDVELGQDGKPRAQPRSLGLPARTLGRVTDLSVTFVAEQPALAWLEQGGQEARALAAFGAVAGSPVVLDLGPAALVAEAARGNIAIAAEAERARALVMWRGLEVPCVDARAAGPCTGFTFKRVRPGAAEPTGLPLSVPVPCASHSVQLASSPGRFHYGVCTREGTDPVTTMFSIQYDPEYARAEPLLKGCLPLGTIALEGRPWLVADCHGKRRGAPVPVADEKVDVEELGQLAISCTPLRAELRQGRFALQLREPRAQLESVLPASLLPTGARAGWSGSSLVVAYLAGSRLETRSYTCQRGKLEAAP